MTENSDEQTMTTTDVADSEPLAGEEATSEASPTTPTAEETVTAEQPSPGADEASATAQPEGLESEDDLAEDEVDTQTYTAQI